MVFQVKSHIPLVEPFPNVKDEFYIVSHKELHQKSFPTTQPSTESQATAFVGKFNDKTMKQDLW